MWRNKVSSTHPLHCSIPCSYTASVIFTPRRSSSFPLFLPNEPFWASFLSCIRKLQQNQETQRGLSSNRHVLYSVRHANTYILGAQSQGHPSAAGLRQEAVPNHTTPPCPTLAHPPQDTPSLTGVTWPASLLHHHPPAPGLQTGREISRGRPNILMCTKTYATPPEPANPY